MTPEPSGGSAGSEFVVDDLTDLDHALIREYERVGRSVDELAYTDDFEAIYNAMVKKGDSRTKAELFRRLLNLRKSARLPRVA